MLLTLDNQVSKIFQMASPDIYRPSKIKGNFQGKDIILPNQFDKISRDLLFQTAESLPESEREFPQALRLMSATGVYKDTSPTTSIRFESAAVRLGARFTGGLRFPEIEDPNFSTIMIKLYCSIPDFILIGTSEPDALSQASSLRHQINSRAPLINVNVFEDIKYARDERWKEYESYPGDIRLAASLLKLVLPTNGLPTNQML